MNLTQAVAAAFTYLEPRVANYPKDDAASMRAWVTDLAKADVRPEELERFVEKWARSEKFMPLPADILGPIYKARQDSDSHLMLDPVKTGEHMGVPEIGSREKCEALGLPFVELREETPLALPSQEAREQANRRLEDIEAKYPVKRMKPARERAEFVEGEDPEAVARRAEMVRSITGGGG